MKQLGASILALGAAVLVALKLRAAKRDNQITTNNTTTMPATTNNEIQHNPLYNQKVRGYRNNNPLNLRISNNNWKGKVPREQNTDGAFEQFYYMPYGFRAAMINIRTIVNRGNNTIEKLIKVWAPDSDGNNSARYAKRVSDTTGYPVDQKIVVTDPQMMQSIAYAMAIVENGSAPQWEDISTAWSLI